MKDRGKENGRRKRCATTQGRGGPREVLQLGPGANKVLASGLWIPGEYKDRITCCWFSTNARGKKSNPPSKINIIARKEKVSKCTSNICIYNITASYTRSHVKWSLLPVGKGIFWFMLYAFMPRSRPSMELKRNLIQNIWSLQSLTTRQTNTLPPTQRAPSETSSLLRNHEQM